MAPSNGQITGLILPVLLRFSFMSGILRTYESVPLVQVVALKLTRFGPIGEMQSVSFRSTYEPVGRGDEALVISRWPFCFIAQHALKGAYSIMVPMTLNNLAIGSANGGAKDFFHNQKIYHAKGTQVAPESPGF